jgi:alkanesulfonate monooxygenase SsuD/methylene tetrahydromethanopterin reductase-like flavin-dependent oxidoreductase (luciferase family)
VGMGFAIGMLEPVTEAVVDEEGTGVRVVGTPEAVADRVPEAVDMGVAVGSPVGE